MPRLHALMSLTLVFLLLSASGQPVDKRSQGSISDTDADMEAADEAVRIADQVSQDSEVPQDTAPVASDSDMQGLDEAKAVAEDAANEQAFVEEPPQQASFLDAQVDRTARSHSAPKADAKPIVSAVAQKTQHKETHASEKKAHEFQKQPVEQGAADAANAHMASVSAQQAARVANQIARHSVHLSEHAKDSLKSAKDAVHKARVDTHGLTKSQKDSLSNAETQLKEATKVAEYGAVKDARYAKVEAANQDLGKLQEKLEYTIPEKNATSELEQMRSELKQLREQLEAKTGGKEGVAKDEEKALEELEGMIKQLEEDEAAGKNGTSASHDELKVEIEKLRDAINRIEIQELTYTIPDKEAPPQMKIHELPETADVDAEVEKPRAMEAVVPTGGIDMDTMMPYGDLEPFGREDTAQELTESSIKESDAMVDQLERAEVAEEKRAVFRALTRLRGAAITSFDGVARSQTGNIDEYNKIHKWRTTHPLHHLADEESDISKWAFPDNADF